MSISQVTPTNIQTKYPHAKIMVIILRAFWWFLSTKTKTIGKTTIKMKADENKNIVFIAYLLYVFLSGLVKDFKKENLFKKSFKKNIDIYGFGGIINL